MKKLELKSLRQIFSKAPIWLLESVIKFDSAFSQYFPHIIGKPDIAAFELEWIWTRFSMNPMNTVRHSNAKKEIDNFVKMISKISTMEQGYWMTLTIALGDDKSKTKEPQKVLLDFILDIVELSVVRVFGSRGILI